MLPFLLPRCRDCCAGKGGAAGSRLQRRDTPWAGSCKGHERLHCEELHRSHEQKGEGQAGGTARSPVPLPEEMLPASMPPEHAHHAGKPPGPQHGLLLPEQGSAAEYLIPPLQPDEP
jgi:hypothetical protein